MNRIFITLALVLLSKSAVFAIIIPSFIQQTQYRWRNDDGDEANASWSAAANTPITLSDTVTRQRLRLEFRNNSGGAAAVDQNLEYSSNGGASWTEITNTATNEFWYTPSTQVANATATTNQMGTATAGSYVAGRVVSAVGAAINLANNSRTEYEWIIKPTSNIQPFKTYTFRTSNQGSTPVIYGQLNTGCVGAIESGNISSSMPFVNCNGTTTLTLNGHTEGGVNFRWQYNNGSGWVDFGNNADNIVTPPIILTTQYRCVVSCGAGGANADTSAIITVSSLPLLVDLGNDINRCMSKGDFIELNAGIFANNPQYQWNDGTNGQIKIVTESGRYIVRVTDQFTCAGTDTIDVVVRENPEVDLGNDTTICNDGVITLDAGDDGIAYSWNTGEVTRTILAGNAGPYVAFVTNDKGCTLSDTFNLFMSGEFPSIQGISITNNGDRTFDFTAVNPQNVIGFEWDFGDGSERSYNATPTHTYADTRSYIVVLHLTSTCGFRSDTTGVHILGINQLDADQQQLSLYPNPAKDKVTIQNKGSFKMKEIVVYNLAGRMVHRSNADARDKHVLDLGAMASGMYTIGIITDQGVAIRKLEVVK